MNNSRICILSQPVHSGKTSLLMNWAAKQQGVCGVLSPDVEGRRKLFNIGTGSFQDFQVDENTPDDLVISVGNYRFSKNAFENARAILLNCLKADHKWLVVDEVGKLELHRNTGLEPALSELVGFYRQHPGKGRLLLVIRDYLLEEAIQHYGLKDAPLLKPAFFYD